MVWHVCEATLGTHLVEVVQDVAVPCQCVRACIVGAADCTAHGVVDVGQASEERLYVCSFDLDELRWLKCSGIDTTYRTCSVAKPPSPRLPLIFVSYEEHSLP